VPIQQLIGIATMALLPVLAVIGYLDERWATHRTTVGAVEATVEYPTQFRAKLKRPMTVEIANGSGATLDAVDVAFDVDYLERFAGVTLTPAPRDAYTVSFTSVAPGERRRIELDFEGDRVGRHDGRIVIRVANRAATVAIQTTVLP
jgi:hypothetical protein